MLASISLLQTLVRQARNELATTILAASQSEPPTPVDDDEDPKALDRWLFNRDSRWHR